MSSIIPQAFTEKKALRARRFLRDDPSHRWVVMLSYELTRRALSGPPPGSVFAGVRVRPAALCCVSDRS